MRHYFGYDINGTLRSVETYGPAGWPMNQCLDDPDCQEQGVVSLRESRATKDPEIINWVLYDCPCDPAQGDLLRDCSCVNTKFPESYVDVESKTMRTKPLRSVYIDDVIVEHGEIITKAPGTSVTLKVVCQSAPDGAKVHCVQKGLIDIALEDEWDLVITNGVSETKTLVAPAQGSKGTLSLSGGLIRPLAFCLRGFATS